MTNDLTELINKFLRLWATFDPYSAFGSGLREYAGIINPETPELLENYRYFLTSFQTTLSKVSFDLLVPRDKIEFLLLDNKIQKELFDLVDLDSYHSNPLKYLDVAFIFDFLLKKYAPLNQRITELSLHLNHFPAYYRQAMHNLDLSKMSPEIVLNGTVLARPTPREGGVLPARVWPEWRAPCRCGTIPKGA